MYILRVLLLLLFITPSFATIAPIPTEEAFAINGQINNHNTINFNWRIAPGYYLYRNHFQFNLISPKKTRLGQVAFPPSQTLNNPTLGRLQVYADNLTLSLPIIDPAPPKATILVTYQGCSESGFCYPPITQKIRANLSENTLVIETQETTPRSLITALNAPSTSINNTARFTELFKSDHMILLFFSFLGFGLLLAFTPCVLPMIPILMSIILGQGKKLNSRKAFLLSLTYVLSMAVTFSIAGLLAGLLGLGLQAAMQNPWIIGLFSAIFVILALSLFGVYELTLPHRLQTHLHHLHQKQTGGTYLGVVIMGCLATLIASPCVSAPLVGALSYISITGNALLGGIALLALGLGMGIPLIVLGTSGGKFLPKSGPWMHHVKSLFGVLLLVIAVMMLSRVLQGSFTLVLWAVLAIFCGIYLGALDTTPHGANWQKCWKSCGIILGAYGLLLLIGAAMGQTDPLKPLGNLSTPTIHPTAPTSNIQRVTSLAQIKPLLEAAQREGKPVLIDFYADWCLDCKVIAKTILQDPKVLAILDHFTVIKADVTANDADNKALEKAFNVFAPPSFIFMNPEGQETQRMIGSVALPDFINALEQAQNTAPISTNLSDSLGFAVPMVPS